MTRRRMHLVGWITAAAMIWAGTVAANAPTAAPDPLGVWPRYRGVDGAGVAEGKPLPATWSKTQNVRWKSPIPGKGWSSPIVWGSRVYLTTAIPQGEVEKPWIPEKMEDNGKGFPTNAEQRWTVLCLDLRTGKRLWQREAARAVPGWLTHPKASHANETPVTDGKRVYAAFGNVGLFCYSLDGKLLWSKRWGAAKMLFNWGTAIGPAVADGRVYMVNDNEEKSEIVCLDAETGQELWRQDRAEGSNWSNPLVWAHDGRTEIVTAGSKVVRSYDPEGALLWQLRGMSYATIPSPYVHGGTLYVASGHSSGPRRPIYAIRPGASGDISVKDDQTSNGGVLWWDKAAAPYVPTPITYQGNVYSLGDTGVLQCYEAATGKRLYRVRAGTKSMMVTASPVAGDGKVFCLDEKGRTVVLQAGPEYKLLAENALEEDTLATPAIADGSLLIRTLGSLYRIGAR